MTFRLSYPIHAGIAAVALTSLSLASGCSKVEKGDPGVETEEAVTVTLAGALGSAEGMTILRDALSDTALASVLDGPASYTLLAPKNEAFELLGEEGEMLLQEDQRPVLIGILRGHLVPGHLTPNAIEEAIERNGGPVSLTTLGEGNLTLSKEGDRLLVTNDEGSTATIAGASTAANNGVVIPLDAVLLPEQEER